MLTTSRWKPVILLTRPPPFALFPTALRTASSNRHAAAATIGRPGNRSRIQVDPGGVAWFLRNTPVAIVLAVLTGCAPSLDWRAVSLPDSALEAQLPCRPARFQREVVVAGRPLTLFMLSCEVAGATYGLATADVGDVTRVDAVLAALARLAGRAIRAQSPDFRPFSLPGATPFSGSVSARLVGQRPDGSAIEESVRLFARGSRVFEASVAGSRLPDSATRPFEDGLRFDLENRNNGPR